MFKAVILNIQRKNDNSLSRAFVTKIKVVKKCALKLVCLSVLHSISDFPIMNIKKKKN